MRFSTLAKYLSDLDSTTKRLEMIDILSKLINELDENEIDKALYLSSGYLKAPFESEKFNIADRMMVKILAYAYEKSVSEVTEKYKEMGDLGNVAYDLAKKESEEKGFENSSDLEINTVHERLLEVAKSEGAGSQDTKINKTSKLLRELSPISTKYIVRMILGTTRLGFTELTITEALAKYLGDKELKKYIERKYNIHPDIGFIAKCVKQKGIKGLDIVGIESGVPILSQKAQRIKDTKEIFEKMGKVVWAEYKLDGTRVQLHLDKGKKIQEIKTLFEEESSYLVKTFTRNLEETTNMYPDIIYAAKKQIDAKSVILDGEAIGYDRETNEFLPFQEIMQRKRKYDVQETLKNVPLKYFVFDLLYLNGKSLIDLPLRERKEKLKNIIKEGNVITVASHIETESSDDLYDYFNKAKEQNLEGLIIKKPDDAYQAGARSYSWIKLKRADEALLNDSVDCVVLGYYAGKGTRSKLGIGGVLLGVFDEKEEKFKTISKLGTGLTEEEFIRLKNMCDRVKTKEKPNNVEMHKMFKPDVYCLPKIVVEIGADEISKSPSHTANYALRFPRLLKFREDKKAQEATSLNEIKDIYENQKRGNIK